MLFKRPRKRAVSAQVTRALLGARHRLLDPGKKIFFFDYVSIIIPNFTGSRYRVAVAVIKVADPGPYLAVIKKRVWIRIRPNFNLIQFTPNLYF